MRQVFLLVAALAIGCGGSGNGQGGASGGAVGGGPDGSGTVTGGGAAAGDAGGNVSGGGAATGDAGGNVAGGGTVSPAPAATPTFSPAAGSYATAQSVAIASATAGATVYYTTDGSDPTTASGVYASPIAVAASGTLKAMAAAPGHAASPIASATYVIAPSGGPIAFDTFCQGSLDAFRRLVASCFHGNPEYVNAVNPVGFFDCVAAGKELAAGRVAYDAAQGGGCLAALSSFGCADLRASSLPAACQSTLTGQVAGGGACFADEDCAAGWCDTSSTCPGTCRQFAPLGGSCATSRCAPGLECDGTGTCRSRSALNGPCPCQRGLWCDASAGVAGTCRAPQTSGACRLTNLDQCEVGFTCVGSPSPTCQPLVGLGGDCSAGDAVCGLGLGYSCDLATNRCVSSPRLGEACTPSHPICIGGYCDVLGTQRCLPYKHIGDACALPEDANACEPGSACHADAGSSHFTCKSFQECQAP